MIINDSTLIIGHGILNGPYCDAIKQMFDTAPMTKLKSVNDEHGGHVVPEDDNDNDRVKYTDIQGVTHYTVGGTNPDFGKIIQFVDDLVPWGEDFQTISYMQIMKYPTESCMNFHKDEADSGDTATAIFNLNDDFTGGLLNVDGHIIKPFRGNMVAFNNSTLRWHGVEPILTGERYVLSIWFAPMDEDPAEQEGKEIYSGALSSDTHPTNKITIKGLT